MPYEQTGPSAALFENKLLAQVLSQVVLIYLMAKENALPVPGAKSKNRLKNSQAHGLKLTDQEISEL